MKILFLTRRFWPEIGGVEKHINEISKRLVNKGNKVIVVTEIDNRKSKIKDLTADGGIPPESGKKSNINGIEIFRIPITVGEKFKKFQIWKWMWNNRQLIKEADIVHCHDVFFWYLPFRFIYPLKKVFITFHGYEGSSLPNKRKIFMHRLAGWLTNGNIAIGESHQKWYGVRPDYISYGGVDKNENDRKGSLHSLRSVGMTNINFKKYDLCFIGRLAADTGIMIYLETLKILKDSGRNYSLVVCGDGPQRQEAEDYVIKYKLNVVFEGFVKDVNKYIYKSNYLFVSRYLGILEGLADKKLIFAVFDNQIKEDYLKKSPFKDWIIIENNPKKLANKIEYFIKNSKERNLKIKNGYNWAKEQTWEKLTDIYLKLWKKDEN